MIKITELGPMRRAGQERLLSITDTAVGLQAYVAVQDTTLGPALGSCRMRPYTSGPAALRDALRLSQAMTRKCALAGLAFGGGACVVIGDPARQKSDALLIALARAIHDLGGAIHISFGAGTSARDMEVMRRITPYARGHVLPSGKPCPATAHGALHAIQAAVAHQYGRTDLMNRRIAVQGLGDIGMRLCAYLAEAGARLIVADTQPLRAAQAAREFGALVVGPEEILSYPADVLSPNGYGGVLNDRTIPAIRARIVAGAADNQLARPRHGTELHHRGIHYVPDYLVGAGSAIDAAQDGPGYSPNSVLRACEAIYQTTARLLLDAQRIGLAPSSVADQIVQQRLAGPPLRGQGPRQVVQALA